jgi:hypothetical protein
MFDYPQIPKISITPFFGFADDSKTGSVIINCRKVDPDVDDIMVNSHGTISGDKLTVL